MEAKDKYGNQFKVGDKILDVAENKVIVCEDDKTKRYWHKPEDYIKYY